DPGRRQPGHGRRLGGREGALAVGPLQRRGVRDLDQRRPLARPDQGRRWPPRGLRLATARTVFAWPHRHPPLRVLAPAAAALIGAAALALTGTGCGSMTMHSGQPRGRVIFAEDSSRCHTLARREEGAVGGDLARTRLNVATLASFAKVMPTRTPLTAD